MAINWKNERRKVKDLRDNPKNSRRFTEKGMADLKASIEGVGYIDPIAINQDNMIIGGHARRKTLLELGIKEIDVRVPDRLLTDKEAIYEPFSGSGTTMIAAEATGRKCYSMELNPTYVDMAFQRWQNFTGKHAHHVDGSPFTGYQRAA